MIEQYSYYQYEIKKAIVMVEEVAELKYVYQIYDPEFKPTEHTVIRESDEWYDTAQEARFAVIGHIDLLENGEG